MAKGKGKSKTSAKISTKAPLSPAAAAPVGEVDDAPQTAMEL
jgi:hypothetical protein